MSEVEKRTYVEQIDLEPLPILHLTHPKLTVPPDPFDFDAPEQIDPAEFSNRMFQKMRNMGGVGLAANQLGLNYRMFVFGDEQTQINVFNPRIVAVSDETWLFKEACLSFPGFELTLRRPKTVTSSYQTETGEIKVQTFSGLAGRIFLHECDHVVLGINFMMYASKFKLDHELRKWKKQQQKKYRR